MCVRTHTIAAGLCLGPGGPRVASVSGAGDAASTPDGVAGILLAAGSGSRLGRPKAAVEIDGETLASRGIAVLRAGGAEPAVLVTGAVPVTVPGALAVHNPDWPTGMGSSLVAGLSVVPEECGAAV